MSAAPGTGVRPCRGGFEPHLFLADMAQQMSSYEMGTLGTNTGTITISILNEEGHLDNSHKCARKSDGY